MKGKRIKKMRGGGMAGKKKTMRGGGMVKGKKKALERYTWDESYQKNY